MHRSLLLVAVVFAFAATVVGCAQKTDQSALTPETSSDSLLATNPVEQPQGNMTPQEQYQPDPQSQEPPAAQSQPRSSTTSKPKRTPSPAPIKDEPKGVTLSAGTPVQVAVNTQLSTESAQVGDSWSGEVKENVIVGNVVVIPAGSIVHGVVSSSKPAEKGSRALLGLSVRSVSVGGKEHSVSASMEPIEAGSTRARNLGAVAGGAAAGALIGKAVGGSGKGALIGGLIGGATAGAGVAASKGYQVVLKEGTTITFSVDEAVLVKS